MIPAFLISSVNVGKIIIKVITYTSSVHIYKAPSILSLALNTPNIEFLPRLIKTNGGSIIDSSQQAVRLKILYVCLVGGVRRGERR